MLTAFSMNLNGNAITVSNKLYQSLLAIDEAIATDRTRTAQALKQLIEENNYSGKPPLKFAMVYPYSSHNYEIRYWMASAGIDPVKDIQLSVIPPQYMVRNLREGLIDGYCAGGPWNSEAVSEDVGKILITGYEIWNNSPEKVLGVTQEWAEKYPNTNLALIKSLLEAAAWIDDSENRTEVVDVLAMEKYIGISKEVIKMSMSESFQYQSDGQSISIPDYNVFHRYQANFPWYSHAAWIITQMYRWGQLDEAINIKQVVESIYRPDIYAKAATELGICFPSVNYKTEGQHRATWSMHDNDVEFKMGADSFLDNKVFDPENIIDYLTGFGVNDIKVCIEELTNANK